MNTNEERLGEQNEAVEAAIKPYIAVQSGGGVRLYEDRNEGWVYLMSEVEPVLTALRTENEQLKAWKKEVLSLESNWDIQEIGKLLGMTLGVDIRTNLKPKILELKARVSELAVQQLAAKDAELERHKTNASVFAECASKWKDRMQKAEQEREAMRTALGLADVWPLRDVLTKLCEAVDHMKEAHHCDTHGHEQFYHALAAGNRLIPLIDAALAGKPVEGKL
jgi:hypothetical protein